MVSRTHLDIQTQTQSSDPIRVVGMARTTRLVRVVSDLGSFLATEDCLHCRVDVQHPWLAQQALPSGAKVLGLPVSRPDLVELLEVTPGAILADNPAHTQHRRGHCVEAQFGLHTEMRRVWISKGVRPEVRQQTRYEWDYLYGALEVVEGRAEFLHLPTVNLDCNQLFLEHLRSSDPDAHHVVIADQAGFHLREGDERLPEGDHIVPLPPYSPELNPCEQLWDVLKDTEGFANGLFESIENLRKALHPGLKRFWDDAQAVLSLIGRSWLQSQANATAKS